jgi:hypothetical protein
MSRVRLRLGGLWQAAISFLKLQAWISNWGLRAANAERDRGWCGLARARSGGRANPPRFPQVGVKSGNPISPPHVYAG